MAAGAQQLPKHARRGDLSGVRFPVFIRSERSRDGALSPLLDSQREVETWIGRAIALGRPLHDLMVVEFCDTADAVCRLLGICLARVSQIGARSVGVASPRASSKGKCRPARFFRERMRFR